MSSFMNQRRYLRERETIKKKAHTHTHDNDNRHFQLSHSFITYYFLLHSRSRATCNRWWSSRAPQPRALMILIVAFMHITKRTMCANEFNCMQYIFFVCACEWRVRAHLNICSTFNCTKRVCRALCCSRKHSFI